MNEKILKSKKVADLRTIARELGIDGYDKMKKDQLISAIMGSEAEEASVPAAENAELTAPAEKPSEGQSAEEAEETAESAPENKSKAHNQERPEVDGILDIAPENNYGFLRFDNFLTSDKDIFVAPAQIRRFRLKTGDRIKGISRLPRDD